MNKKFTPLVCDDDVLLFEKDTFKISRFKELISTDINNKLSQSIHDHQTRQPQRSVDSSFLQISIGQERLELNEIEFKSSIKACQILRVGGKAWQKGKLKIQIIKSIINQKPATVCLEFCPDEPDEHESPLNDLRKMI
ncbi:MAG: KGK family protein [Nostoc sp. JL34]|uniref:KGK domain-containing protein n=1 Tax=Nostoc sp. JL34 TaxID=2815397 RepID=UPI001DF8C4D2|nr:KGK domain-containing protein [Nostoc sp. JL34]MBN3881539.1 KGK family protein [Nostoc sp. JL34]